MDVKLNEVYEALTETLYIDLKGAVALNETQTQRFKEYFALDHENLGLFTSDVNLIFTFKPVFEEMQSFIKPNQIITVVDSREHNLFFAVYPHFNDTLITQAIEEG